MAPRSSRFTENFCALLGAVVLAAGALAGPAARLGLCFAAACPSPSGTFWQSIPWEQLLVGFILVLPKTINRATGRDAVLLLASRMLSGTGTALRALKPKSKPPAEGEP